jgi:hypothetical protein
VIPEITNSIIGGDHEVSAQLLFSPEVSTESLLNAIVDTVKNISDYFIINNEHYQMTNDYDYEPASPPRMDLIDFANMTFGRLEEVSSRIFVTNSSAVNINTIFGSSLTVAASVLILGAFVLIGLLALFTFLAVPIFYLIPIPGGNRRRADDASNFSDDNKLKRDDSDFSDFQDNVENKNQAFYRRRAPPLRRQQFPPYPAMFNRFWGYPYGRCEY